MKLSGVREDYTFLREIACVNKDERRFVDEVAQIPLLLHPANVTTEYDDYVHDTIVAKTVEQRAAFVREEIINLPMAFAYMDLRGVQGVAEDMYFVISRAEDTSSTKVDCIVYSRTGGELYKYAAAVNMYTGRGGVQLRYGVRNARVYTPDEFDTNNMDDVITECASNAANAIFGACALSAWAREHDQYPVIQRGIIREQKGTKPCKRRDLPRLIYMNKMPSAHAKSLGGHHESPRGHERRGHYKTLRHEKYKYHPKYGVEKGVYVRPAWVGDKSVVREGNRYTVMI